MSYYMSSTYYDLLRVHDDKMLKISPWHSLRALILQLELE